MFNVVVIRSRIMNGLKYSLPPVQIYSLYNKYKEQCSVH